MFVVEPARSGKGFLLGAVVLKPKRLIKAYGRFLLGDNREVDPAESGQVCGPAQGRLDERPAAPDAAKGWQDKKSAKVGAMFFVVGFVAGKPNDANELFAPKRSEETAVIAGGESCRRLGKTRFVFGERTEGGRMFFERAKANQAVRRRVGGQQYTHLHGSVITG